MLRLLKLNLENVGPFDAAAIEFLEDADDPRTVTLITGENGTGKTVVIDAIRLAFGENFARLERDLSRRDKECRVAAEFFGDDNAFWVKVVDPIHTDWRPQNTTSHLSRVEFAIRQGKSGPGWVTDYWRSELARDQHTIQALRPPSHRNALQQSLQGTYQNVAVTETLVYIDYLRDSRDPGERVAGEALWAIAQKIVAASLLDGGHLTEIHRSTFTPMIEQAGHKVPLANLSSGNAYLIGRMLTLLGRMYSLTVVDGKDPAKTNEMPGLLLIDEAENHLHPQWQKRFLPMVREIFPNLQIIATTHSPFILASVADARVFVTRFDREKKTCVIEPAEADYANRPVDEILASEAFDETRPFRTEISELLDERAAARARGDVAARQAAERRLKDLNPAYFGWFDLDEELAGVGK